MLRQHNCLTRTRELYPIGLRGSFAVGISLSQRPHPSAFKMHLFSIAKCACIISAVLPVLANPTQARLAKSTVFDVQGHRGGRGETVESTLPSFAWGLINGVTTLELDNGITKDGVVIVWHDESIVGEKCNDTVPAFKNDPSFPYVGKNVVDLTLAQIKTLDCGSKRLSGYPLQLTYPGTKISTLTELFKFAQCADPSREVNWNIESKINPVDTTATQGVNAFVTSQHKEFVNSGYKLSKITYQSFDWRTLIAMKAVEPIIPTAALVEYTTAFGANNATSSWLAGLRIQDFPGATTGEQIAYAAKSIKADIISPNAVSSAGIGIDPADADYIPFATKEMILQAHKLSMAVKSWTVNRLNIAEQLIDWGVDGIITDYPAQMRKLVRNRGEAVSSTFPKSRVLNCLNQHLALQKS